MDEQGKPPTEEQIFEGMFFSLVISVSTAAMAQMGKMANPVTGQVERNLAQAKGSIDILRMLKAKTAGNLGEREQGFLDKTVSELQMNFLEESKKGDTPPKGTEPAAARNGETAKQEDRPEASGTPKPQAAEKKRKPKATKKKTAKPKGKKK